MALDELKGMKGRVCQAGLSGCNYEKTTGGAKIVEIAKGSAAEKAGLKIDDIITKLILKQ
jgi:S1-C subfamily serine protease